jgi:glycosyltransferase involved in cell wall biosynthesis
MPNLTTAAPPAVSPAEGGANPRKVLHLIAGNLYGGVETLLLTLAQFRHLSPGMEPHFAVCYEGRLSSELRAAGVPVYVLGNARISRPWTVWRARRRLGAILGGRRFDVVFCHMAWTMAMFGGTARSAAAKVIFWAHGFQTGRGWLERLARRVTPDLAIANSRATLSSISSLWPDIDNRLLYYPVALPALTESGHWRATLRREYSATNTTTVIVQVSRLEAWKGHRLHLRALSLLKDVPGWVCWFVGGPQNPEEESYLADLKKSALELGIAERIRFLGQRSDVRNLLGAGDLFCQPNEAPEPFGIVFIEALWTGLPVVTTGIGGALEIVDESCGLLTKHGDPESLAGSLRLLIESRELRSRLGAGGPARAAQLCEPGTQISALGDLVRSLATATEKP